MGMHLNGLQSGQETCLLFEDCGVLSASRIAEGIACPDFASPSCATNGISPMKARLAVRQAMLRIHERLRAATMSEDGEERS